MDFNKLWSYLTTDKSKQKVPQQRQKQQQPEAVDEINAPTSKKKLGYVVILFILINSILGSSLFYLPGLGVISSGAASIIAWATIFIIATLIMLYMSELITLHPTSGGTYEFCKRAYGRFGAFISGWLIWIAGNFGMALGIVAAAEYFIPATYANYFVLRLIFAVIWIIVLNFMAYRGVDAGATMLLVFGVIATFVVLAMTLPSFLDIPGLFDGILRSPFELSLFQPFFQHEGISILAYLGLTLLLISEAFMGFEVVSYMANEIKEPKQIPKILISGMAICGVIMTLYIFSSLGTVNYHDYVNDARPFAVQALNTMGEWGQEIVVFGMYLVIVGAAAAWPITGSRLIRAMAKDKLFLRHFAKSHPKHGSPHRAVYFQTLVVGLFSWFVFRGYLVGWGDSYRTNYMMYVVLSLIVLSLILLTVPILRRKEKDLERPFKAPLPWFGPIAFVVLAIALIVNWIIIEGSSAWSTLQLASSFIIMGLPFYFFVEMLYNPQAILKVNEKLSFLTLIGDKLFFPLTIKNKIFKRLHNIEKHTVLEYGCAFGSLTKKLAQKVTPKGRVYATDISLSKVNVANKRTKHLNHVSVHHHPHLDDFKLKLPQKVDTVVSIGALSNMQNPAKILYSLGRNVKKGGKIVFLDYDKFFYIIPNVAWIENDDQLTKIFRKAGFKILVERKRGILWQYIIITGVKV